MNRKHQIPLLAAVIGFTLLDPRPTPRLHAQVQTQVQNLPDCLFPFNLTAVGQLPAGNGFDNRKQGCTVWSVVYFSSGFSAVSVTFQSAADNNGAAGSWGTGFPVQQTVLAGSNPASSTTGGFLWIEGTNAFVRMQLSSKTGTGNIQGAAFGWAIPNAQ
jgi:hypothetical protein